MGWALENLGSGDCKRIAEGLFEVEKDYARRSVLHGACPFHGDKTSSFAYNYASDWYKCQGCDEGGDLVKMWCELTGRDSQDLKAFKDEFGEGSGGQSRSYQKPKPAATPEPVEELPEVFVDEAEFDALPPLPAERIKELEELRGWTADAIERMDLREFVAAGRFKKIAIPIRDDKGRLCNIRLYQPGAKQMKIVSWYDRKCRACGGGWEKKGKSKVCAKCGALPTDYGRTRLYPPPSQWQPGLLWLVEGESDLLCALSKGLNATTQTAGAGTWTEEFSQAMAGRDVVIAYDADQTGHKGALAAAQCIAEHADSVRVLVWPKLMGAE
jgi:putative DNA primase/helicase